MTDQARSFGTVADRYDTFRPGYADAAVPWILGDRPLRVADLGAGTGILSRLVHGHGHEVVAVEPDDQMRARLIQASPGVTALAGSAEDIPLPDGSVDAVVTGQAYHWFDQDRAHPEIARVLKPGGVFAALWNDADLSAPWTERFAEIIDGRAAIVRSRQLSDFGNLFGPVELGEFRHEMDMTMDGLLGMAKTRSPYIVGTAEQQREIEKAIRDLGRGPELAGRARFPMPHITRVHRSYAL